MTTGGITIGRDGRREDGITVTVRDYEWEAATWGHGLFSPALMTLRLPRYTPRGERRSDPTDQLVYEDGVSFAVSRWTLDSGRGESYAEAIALAAAGGDR